MLISEFDYELPEELIAQKPTEKREQSKMMVLNRTSHTIEHKNFFNIVDYLDENCILILNNTKVMPARLYGYKDTGAKIEIFLLKEKENHIWEVLIRPSKRVKVGTTVKISDELLVEILEPLEDAGKWLVKMVYEGNIFEILHKVGNIPLPPYIERKMADDEIKKLDFERYQTVYAKDEGSVAAPTAGLHFTQDILEQLKNKGVKVGYVTLNVGIGTFRPVKCDNILDHKMDSESFEISEETANLINRAKVEGKKLVAVGTTTVRTLETAYKQFGEIKACRSASELFIYPPYEFKVVDKLITNFHLPKSTLLLLVSALATKEFIFEAYAEAIKNKYRFYSYGDCMFIN
ncbi:MAG: tRNA preQ1(34) S-adenosylmethionine ribosyltransferase-isomerase QueA [Candidatus Gastranaerophilales bacterium]|nr:tRNA preQ1(34) S-adenosylmethionine ribosyltransferase-isomerase QueA [Candidatus Gastranaerophilales bacterium]